MSGRDGHFVNNKPLVTCLLDLLFRYWVSSLLFCCSVKREHKRLCDPPKQLIGRREYENEAEIKAGLAAETVCSIRLTLLAYKCSQLGFFILI